MKTKRLYTAPVTERAIVELEGGFCGSVDEKSDPKVETTGHEINSATDTQINQWNSTDWE